MDLSHSDKSMTLRVLLSIWAVALMSWRSIFIEERLGWLLQLTA